MSEIEAKEEKRQKERSTAMMFSVISNLSLVILKLAVGIITGLVSIIAEALHSIDDLLASIIAYFGVRTALQPPDKDHQYGHGKVEIITGTIESILIFVVGVAIIYEGVKKFIDRTHPKLITAGIAIMAFAGVLNWLLSVYLIKKGKELRSLGIEVDGQNHLADVITSLGVAGALIALKLTGIWWIDPIAAILLGVWVLIIFTMLSIKLMGQLVDKGLDENEMRRIKKELDKFKEIKDYHKIRTRQSGSTIFIDMHIKVDKNLTVKRAHALTKEIEKKFQAMYGDCNVLVHVEPYFE